MNYIAMLALLNALTQELNILELQLAQLQASSSVAVATTTPIVFSTLTPSVNNPLQTSTQNQPLGAVTQPTSTCSLTAINEGDSTNPKTYITWSLTGLPTSTIGHVSSVEIDVTSGNYDPTTHLFNPLSTSTMDSMNLINQITGLYPNQNITLAGGWYQSITADFDGTTCTVNPYWN